MKVRHPNVEEQIGIDFIIMKAIASIIDRTPGLKWLKLSETMSQFSATIASQTDLGVEGRHLYLFNHYFKNWKGVSFPKPIILTQSILVESFEFGDSVDKYSRTISCTNNNLQVKKEINHFYLTSTDSEKGTKNENIEKAKYLQENEKAKHLQEKKRHCNIAHFIVTTGQDIYLKMLLQDNLMHADLHPGNILIQQSYPIIKSILKNDEDDKNNLMMKKELKLHLNDLLIESESETLLVASVLSKPNIKTKTIQINSNNLKNSINENIDPIFTKIVLVDAGMVARLEPDERKNFIGLLESMGEGKGDHAANYVMKFSTDAIYNDITKISFRKDMKELFERDCRGYGTSVNIGVTLRGVLNLVRIHQISIDANYATLVMNCLCLDSLVQNLLPSYNILDGAKPLLRFNKFLKRIPEFKF